jgi:hypothetical protein
MSTASNAIQGMINNALMQTHTAFCAKVISVNGNLAKVQPLNMIKAIGGKAQKQAVIPDVPILQHVGTVYSGDTVFCMCAERDITETRKGNFALPVQGRHMLSDAVIVGKF